MNFFQSPKIKINLNAPEKMGNVAEKLDMHERRRMGDFIADLVKLDQESMNDWLGKAKGYLDSVDSETNTKAPQNMEQRGSNEDSPPRTALTMSAVIQFTARATASILSEPDLARASEPGGEPLAAWVSSQLRSVDPEWVTDTDPLIMHMAVTGLGWRKRWFDDTAGQFRSTFLTVEEVVVNSNIKSLDRAPRITHKFEKYPYEIQRSIEMGHWVDYNPRFEDTRDPQAPHMFYEVDMWLDLDDDGYDEPWTVTVATEDTYEVVKLIPRWTKKTIVNNDEFLIFRPFRRYYAYKMIPDPKGSFFPHGFGWLLSKAEASADRLLASIDDIAKSSAENGGVATGGVGIPEHIELKSNRITTIPVDGRNLNDVLTLFPPKQVTPGMYQSLDKIITLADRLAGTLNMLENAPASMTATMAKGLIDAGAQVQNSVHRRLVGSMTEEFRSFVKMADALDQLPTGLDKAQAGVLNVSADPNMSTELHRSAVAQIYREMLGAPVIFNPQVVAKRFAETMRLPNPQELLAPPPQPVPLTEKERTDFALKVEKEISNRIKSNASRVLNIAQAIKAFTEANVAMAGVAGLEQQVNELSATIQAMKEDELRAGELGVPQNQGMAGPPDDGMGQGPAQAQAGGGPGGNVQRGSGPPQPGPAGAGGSVPAIAPAPHITPGTIDAGDEEVASLDPQDQPPLFGPGNENVNLRVQNTAPSSPAGPRHNNRAGAVPAEKNWERLHAGAVPRFGQPREADRSN